MAASAQSPDLGNYFAVSSSRKEETGDVFFKEAGRGKALVHIFNLCKFKPGLMMLMGDEGSGRSVILAGLKDRLKNKQGKICVIDSVVQTEIQLYEAIAKGFELDPESGDDDNPDQVADYVQKSIENEALAKGFELDDVENEPLVDRVQTYLENCLRRHRPVIIAVDDVQSFSLSMIDALIQLLGAFRGMNLILSGDNNLKEMLKHFHIENLTTHEIPLKPLNREEIRQFIHWRLPFNLKDDEFEDIVVTTEGNLAALEREAEKREQAHNATATTSLAEYFSGFSRTMPFYVIVVIVVFLLTYQAISMFTGDGKSSLSQKTAVETVAPPTETKLEQVEKTVAPVVTTRSEPLEAETTVADVSPQVVAAEDDEFLNRQMALLASTETPETETTGTEERSEVMEKPVAEVEETLADPEPIAEPIPDPEPEPVAAVERVELASLSTLPPTRTVATDKRPTSGGDEAFLMALPPGNYSIQVLGAGSKKTIENFIAGYSGTGDLYYFRTRRNGKDWYSVLYGVYADRASAIEATGQLPDEIKKHSPWARKMADIHGLIEADSL